MCPNQKTKSNLQRNVAKERVCAYFYLFRDSFIILCAISHSSSLNQQQQKWRHNTPNPRCIQHTTNKEKQNHLRTNVKEKRDRSTHAPIFQLNMFLLANQNKSKRNKHKNNNYIGLICEFKVEWWNIIKSLDFEWMKSRTVHCGSFLIVTIFLTLYTFN